jgi:hypothetical protein
LIREIARKENVSKRCLATAASDKIRASELLLESGLVLNRTIAAHHQQMQRASVVIAKLVDVQRLVHGQVSGVRFRARYDNQVHSRRRQAFYIAMWVFAITFGWMEAATPV